MSESGESALEVELQSLEAIYISELTYTRNPDETVNQIELLLHPATGHDLTKQYVCMTLVFTMNSMYPDEPPEIEIRNPRGLGEEEITSLVEDMVLKAEDMKGDAMMYTLIEMAKDSLTEGNVPHCPCVVCLEHFINPDSFHRTDCYHYFHIHCLYKYLAHTRIQMQEDDKEATERRHLDGSISDKNNQKKILCPVCRCPLDEKSLAVTCAPELLEDEKTEVFVISHALKEQQLKMAQLYEQQKAKGGIIDLEVEKNKYLVNPEDRMPISSITVNPTSLLSTSNKNPGTVYPETRKENKSKHGGTSHHARGRNWGHGHHGRSYQDFHKEKLASKSKPGDRAENKDSRSAFRSSFRNEKTEKDFKKKESVPEEKKISNESKEEIVKRDIVDADKEKIVVKEEGNSEKNKQDNRLIEETSDVQCEEFEERDVNNIKAADEYKYLHKSSSPRVHNDDGRDRGRFEVRNGGERYKKKPGIGLQKENVLYNEEVIGAVNVRKNEEGKSSRVVDVIMNDQRVDGVGKHLRKNKGRSEKIRNFQNESCLSAEDEAWRGATGLDSNRGVNSSHEDYDDERGGEGMQRMKRYETRGYREGAYSQRGRGFGSGYRGSKFNGRKESSTEQSRHPRGHYDRPHHHHTFHGHHQQTHYHHSRHGEERERMNQIRSVDALSASTEERNSNNTTVVDAHRTGTDLETVPPEEEDEEADVWRTSSDYLPQQSLTIKHSQTESNLNLTRYSTATSSELLNFDDTDYVYITGQDMYKSSNIYTRSTFEAKNNLYRNTTDIAHKNNPNKVSVQNVGYHDSNNNSYNNTTNKCLLKLGNICNKTENRMDKDNRSSSYMARDFSLKVKSESNTFTTHRNIKQHNSWIDQDEIKNGNFDHFENTDNISSLGYMDRSNYLPYNATVNAVDNNSDNEEWDDEVNIYAFERLKIKRDHLEDYDKQIVVPRNKYYENKLKVKYNKNEMGEKLKQIRNDKLKWDKKEQITQSQLVSKENNNVDDPFKGKSILELYMENKARESNSSHTLNDKHYSLRVNTSDSSLSDHANSLNKCDNRLKKLEPLNPSGYSALNVNKQFCTCLKQFCSCLQINDVIDDGALAADTLGSDFEQLTSLDKINSAVDRSNLQTEGSAQDHSTNVSYYDQFVSATSQGETTKKLGYRKPTNTVQQGRSVKVSYQDPSIKDPIIIMNNLPHENAFSYTSKYNNTISTTDKSGNILSSSFDESSLQNKTLLSSKMAPNRETLSRDENTTIQYDMVTTVPQSFKHFKKAPLLKFPKKNLKTTSGNSLWCLEAKTLTKNDKVLTTITPNKAISQVNGGQCLSPEKIDDLYNFYNAQPQTIMSTLNRQLPATAMPVLHMQFTSTAMQMLDMPLSPSAMQSFNSQLLPTVMSPHMNIQLPATTADISALLTDSYMTSSLINTNLQNFYHNNFGLNSTMAYDSISSSLNSTHTSNASNTSNTTL